MKLCRGQEILRMLGDELEQEFPRSLGLFSSSLFPAGAGSPRTLQGHVDHKVHHSVALAKFIVISGNKLDKMVIERNTSPSIKGRRIGVTVKVAKDNLVCGIAQDAFQVTLQCLFHHLLDVIIFSSFL